MNSTALPAARCAWFMSRRSVCSKPTPSSSSSAPRSRCWRSTRRIASRNGATTSARRMRRSARCRQNSAPCRPSRSPPRRTARRARISSGNCSAASPAVFVHGFDRPNLRLAMRAKTGSRKQITDFVAAHAGQSGIIYRASRRKTEELAEASARGRRQGIAVPRRHGRDGALAPPGYFPAGGRCRRGRHRRVRNGHRQARPSPPCCTPTCPPTSRAIIKRSAVPAATGFPPIRSRSTAWATEAAPPADRRKRLLGRAETRPHRSRLNALVALCELPRRPRQTLLAYFGETTQPCGNCDPRRDGAEVIDGTIAAQRRSRPSFAPARVSAPSI